MGFVVGPDIKMAPHGIVAEWLRRLPAKQLCVARESSNLSNVVSKNCSVGSVAEHLPSKQKVVGSSPTRSSLEDIAQLVERCLGKAKAGGSTPLIPTCRWARHKNGTGFVGSVVEHLPCKQTGRRFESGTNLRIRRGFTT